jgi:uncharacterized membrane protein required for colicin V production
MDNPATVTVDQVVLMALILGVFGLIGFRRGANRELLTLVGVAISFVLLTQLLDDLSPIINRLHKLGRFALGGGIMADDPTIVWGQVKGLPGLIATEAHQRNLGALLFALLTSASYYIGFRAAPPASTPMSRFLGLLLGAVNGFIIASYLFRYALVTTKATIELSSGEMRETVMSGQTIGKIVTLLIVALIAFGLYGATRRRSS